MQVEKRDGTAGRRVLTGMMVSRAVLAPVAAKWDRKGLFGTRWENLIGGWAVNHYEKYKKPPGSAIEGYFDRWAETGTDRETVALVSSFLSGLSAEYERLRRDTSPDYILDEAAHLFRKVQLEDFKEKLEGELEAGDIDKAFERVHDFRRIEIGAGTGVNVLTDAAAMEAAFEQRMEPLLTYPGALGNFFGPVLARDQFISFMGKEKVGKSFWLQDLAYRALCQERNVAYFEVGDNSQPQVLLRLARRAAERPADPGRYEWPLSIEPGEDGRRGLPDVGREWREEDAPLTAKSAMKILGKVAARVGAERYKLSCHPNSSISVRGIEGVLEGWEREGWVPDVVVVDYADILAPIDGRAETRDQINTTWKALRALSQRHHCCVVTATQTDADSYDARVLRRDNFSEDKRKYAHVTGMVGINQTDAEKEAQLYRLNWVLLRELAFSEQLCCWTAACLSVGNPCVLSTF